MALTIMIPMFFRSRPGATLKSLNKTSTAGSYLSWRRAIPISSANALAHAMEYPPRWILIMCNSGSMAITNNEPDKGQPCKRPEKIINIETNSSFDFISSLVCLYNVHDIHQSFQLPNQAENGEKRSMGNTWADQCEIKENNMWEGIQKVPRCNTQHS